MMRALLILLAFISLVAFPWPLTAALALLGAPLAPILPFAIGILADLFYRAPHAPLLPLASIFGGFVTAVTFFVRSRLSPGIIER